MRRRVVLLLTAVALLAPALAIAIGEARGGRALERRLYDSWFTIRGTLPRPQDVVVVAIDLDSEESLGRYPWSRDWHVRLIRNLHRAGARVVAFDATFADPFPVQDTLLRQVIDSTGIVVLGAKTEVIFVRNARGSSLEEPAGVLRGVPIGIVDIQGDPTDGVIREYPILHRYAQAVVPQLGIQALLHYLDIAPEALQEAERGWRLGERWIPRGAGTGMLVNFLGTPGFVSTYSYAGVVDDAETDLGEWDMDFFEVLEQEDRFRHKIVLVGTTIPEHQDVHATPFRDAEGDGAIPTPGVEIHAHAVATVLAGNHIRPLSRPLQYLWIFSLGVLTVALAPRVRGAWGAVLTVVLAGVALATAWYLFSRHGIWPWSATPVLSLGLSYAGSTATLYVAEEQEKASIQRMFQQYVAASLVDELIKHPELLSLGGEERVISVLFSDVQDFSTISERLTPTQLVELLNEYLTAMTDIVLAHGGIIDKYQGDAIMAEFGVPVPLPDHALRACRAGLEMTQELARLRERWAREGKPLLHARVGINTGQVLVGNLGSRRIMDYTVMGDHVNLASRLEGANKLYGTRIMVSEFTWDEVGSGLVGRELDRIRVKGKEHPVRIYEVLATREQVVSPATEQLLEDFASALELYKAASFAEALESFRGLAERHPEDGPRTYCALHRTVPGVSHPASGSRLGRRLHDEDQVARASRTSSPPGPLSWPRVSGVPGRPGASLRRPARRTGCIMRRAEK